MGSGARRTTSRRAGFTLLETALAMVIVMVGVIAMIEAQQAFIHSNSWSSHEATGTYLANEIRERMRNLPRHDPVSGLALGTGPGGQTVVNGVGREPGEVTILDFDDMDDYDGVEFGGNGNFDGPVDAFGTVIPDVDVNGVTRIDPTTGLAMPLQGWSQAITVEKVDPYDFSQPVAWAHTDVYRTVDRFPLRVTVTVKFQGPLDPQPDIVTTMTWIAPAH